jgi:hypothetical protein
VDCTIVRKRVDVASSPLGTVSLRWERQAFKRSRTIERGKPFSFERWRKGSNRSKVETSRDCHRADIRASEWHCIGMGAIVHSNRWGLKNVKTSFASSFGGRSSNSEGIPIPSPRVVFVLATSSTLAAHSDSNKIADREASRVATPFGLLPLVQPRARTPARSKSSGVILDKKSRTLDFDRLAPEEWPL